jgi:hypothetical protein
MLKIIFAILTLTQVHASDSLNYSTDFYSFIAGVYPFSSSVALTFPLITVGGSISDEFKIFQERKKLLKNLPKVRQDFLEIKASADLILQNQAEEKDLTLVGTMAITIRNKISTIGPLYFGLAMPDFAAESTEEFINFLIAQELGQLRQELKKYTFEFESFGEDREVRLKDLYKTRERICLPLTKIDLKSVMTLDEEALLVKEYANIGYRNMLKYIKDHETEAKIGL